MLITSPGLYKNISIEDYHSSMGISNSGIRDLLPPNCPRNYWYKHLSGMYDPKDSPATAIGSLVHTLVLEPHLFDQNYFCYPVVDRRTKDGKEIYEKAMKEAEGKRVISSADLEKCMMMAESIKSHSVYKEHIDLDAGNVENSIAWIDKESGALLRTRPDYYNDNVIIDIKTSRDISTNSFARSAHQYGYHSQGAMACDGVQEVTGRVFSQVILLVVCTEAPYLTRAFSISKEMLTRGRQEYLTGARIYQGCIDFDVWPGYEEIVEELELPSWVANTDTDGE